VLSWGIVPASRANGDLNPHTCWTRLDQRVEQLAAKGWTRGALYGSRSSRQPAVPRNGERGKRRDPPNGHSGRAVPPAGARAGNPAVILAVIGKGRRGEDYGGFPAAAAPRRIGPDSRVGRRPPTPLTALGTGGSASRSSQTLADMREEAAE